MRRKHPCASAASVPSFFWTTPFASVPHLPSSSIRKAGWFPSATLSPHPIPFKRAKMRGKEMTELSNRQLCGLPKCKSQRRHPLRSGSFLTCRPMRRRRTSSAPSTKRRSIGVSDPSSICPSATSPLTELSSSRRAAMFGWWAMGARRCCDGRARATDLFCASSVHPTLW